MAHSEIQIRLATSADAAAIATVLYAAFVEYRSFYTAEAFAATTPGSDQIQRRTSEGPVWIALQAASAVGTAAAVQQASVLYIRGMAVLPSARGHGIARLLFKQIDQFAAAHGCTQLTLSTTPFLSAAIQLYQALGFYRSSAGPHDLYGTLLTLSKPVPAID